MKKHEEIKNAWAEAQALMPNLKKITLKEAVIALVRFKDNPQGQLENEIDSALIDFEISELKAAVREE